MKIKGVICPRCGHKGYAADEVYDNGYKEVVPYCPECHALIYIDEIQVENNKRKAEMERKGRVSFEDTLKLPRKYGVSRKDVSEVLNLDSLLEPGVIGKSIWEGEVPTQEESDRIQKALADPQYFLEMVNSSALPEEKKARIRGKLTKKTQ